MFNSSTKKFYPVIKKNFKQLTYGYISSLIFDKNIKKHEPFVICPNFFEEQNKVLSTATTNLLVLDVLNEEQSLDIILSKFKTHYRHLILCAHGESSHLRIPQGVICAQDSTTAEKNIDGEIIEQGCNGTSCRRKRTPTEVIVHCEDIICDHAYLLSCNSACIAGELFKSSSSLVRGFFRNGTKSLLGCLDSQNYSQQDISLTETLIRRKVSMTEIAYILNQMSYREYRNAPFCVYVNKNQDYSESILPSNNLRICNLPKDDFIKLARESVYIFNINTKDRCYCVDVEGDTNIQVLCGWNLILILSGTKESFVKISDISQDMTERSSYLKNIFSGLEIWNMIFSENFIEDVHNKLKEQYRRLIPAKNFVLRILRSGICFKEIFNRHREYVIRNVKNIQKLLMRFLLQNELVNFPEKIWNNHFYEYEIKKCQRCGYKLRRYTLKDIPIYVDICGLCGVSCVARVGFEAKIFFASSNFILRTNFSNEQALFYLEIQDKARGVIVQRILEYVDLRQSEISFKINLNLVTGKDLHTYRGLIFFDLNFIYFRGRFNQYC